MFKQYNLVEEYNKNLTFNEIKIGIFNKGRPFITENGR